MKLKKILLCIGISSLIYGAWSVWEATSYLRRSELVNAQVTGYSGLRGFEREHGDCTAISKGCAANVTYILSNGSSFSTQIDQPIFTRAKTQTITLAVDPLFPDAPRIASVHVLFRNQMVWIALGLVLILIPGLLLHGEKLKKSEYTKN